MTLINADPPLTDSPLAANSGASRPSAAAAGRQRGRPARQPPPPRTGQDRVTAGHLHRRPAAHHQQGPPLPPAWGWKIPDGGRAVHVAAGPEYQGTTTQLCGLYPFVAGSGTPVAGTPV